MMVNVACRAFHVAGKVWLHSLPSHKWSEQLFYLKHGLKSQVHYGKRAHQGETRPRVSCSSGSSLVQLEGLCNGLDRNLDAGSTLNAAAPRMLIKVCMNTLQVMCTHAAQAPELLLLFPWGWFHCQRGTDTNLVPRAPYCGTEVQTPVKTPAQCFVGALVPSTLRQQI